MGANFSAEPVVEKETERDHNDTFNVAVSSCQGWRMSQEDNHSLMLDLPGEHKAAFFAVYDGHGSAKVSKHASEGLWRHLVENDMYIKGNFEEALRASFLSFDQEVFESVQALLAGTTAVCLLVVNNTIYCANIGDSRGVASVNCSCVPLSFDHKPENPQELKRILAAGGYVLGNRVNGNLALSRAFGDFHYKANDELPPEQQIVSPYPDVKKLELNDDLDFLVLACDGIWDVLSSEEVVEFVISRLEQSMEPGLICEQLTTRCLATDYDLIIGCDNMTVLLVCYTRGRTWMDYCTDIFNKNTKRLGMINRVRPTASDEGNNLETPSNSQPDSSCAQNLETPSSDANTNQQQNDESKSQEDSESCVLKTTENTETSAIPTIDEIISALDVVTKDETHRQEPLDEQQEERCEVEDNGQQDGCKEKETTESSESTKPSTGLEESEERKVERVEECKLVDSATTNQSCDSGGESRDNEANL